VKEAIEDYIKTHSLFIASAAASAPTASAQPVAAPQPSAATPSVSGENVEKFRKLAQTCYKKGNPTATELQLLEKFREKYGISPAQAEQIAAEFTAKPAQADPVQEYSLMFRAFVENDGDIDLEEQSQLLDLQEELGLTTEQANIIEHNIREELGLST
jgi:hypothetical protein